MSDANLPLDPDVDAARHPRIRPVELALVFVGGTLGTAAREGLGLLVPTSGHLPWAILVANLVGAFLLGVLLESLVRRGPDTGRRRGLRLLLGTGFLGGFTTYSALASDTAALFAGGFGWTGVGYALGTVAAGAVATALGILVASRGRAS